MLKGYHKKLLEEESVSGLVVREAVNLSKIAHPFIVACARCFQSSAYAYFLNEYIEGTDLVDVIN